MTTIHHQSVLTLILFLCFGISSHLSTAANIIYSPPVLLAVAKLDQCAKLDVLEREEKGTVVGFDISIVARHSQLNSYSIPDITLFLPFDSTITKNFSDELRVIASHSQNGEYAVFVELLAPQFSIRQKIEPRGKDALSAGWVVILNNDSLWGECFVSIDSDTTGLVAKIIGAGGRVGELEISDGFSEERIAEGLEIIWMGQVVKLELNEVTKVQLNKHDVSLGLAMPKSGQYSIAIGGWGLSVL